MKATRKRENGKKQEACCVPGCERTATRRGLCNSCYQMAWLDVRENKTTWHRLEGQRLARPTRSADSPMRKAQAKTGAAK